jgi:hypothetical protein
MQPMDLHEFYLVAYSGGFLALFGIFLYIQLGHMIEVHMKSASNFHLVV